MAIEYLGLSEITGPLAVSYTHLLAGQGVTVLLRPTDESKQGLLRAVFPQASFETDRAIRCGGFKLVVGRVLYDETLDAAFAAEQERFTAESGLRV